MTVVNCWCYARTLYGTPGFGPQCTRLTAALLTSTCVQVSTQHQARCGCAASNSMHTTTWAELPQQAEPACGCTTAHFITKRTGTDHAHCENPCKNPRVRSPLVVPTHSVCAAHAGTTCWYKAPWKVTGAMAKIAGSSPSSTDSVILPCAHKHLLQDSSMCSMIVAIIAVRATTAG